MVKPAGTHEVSDALRACDAADWTVQVRGGGTKLHWGVPPARTDVVLDLSRLTGVVEHAAGDLVVTVRAGTRLADLQRLLAREGQRLALDPPLGPRRAATVGGTVATGSSGPLRMRYGTPRDLLIGVTFVCADGVVARAGGKVVKNVAGYDLGKLVAGSHGTLGVLTEATFRLHPVPTARAFVVRSIEGPADAREVTRRVLASQLDPAALEMDWTVRSGSAALLLEGTSAGVAARARDARILLGGDAGIVADPPTWWGRYPLGPDDVLLRLTAPVDELHAGIRALGGAVAVRGSLGAGVVHAAMPGATEPAAVAAGVEAVRGALGVRGGSCVVVHAPAEVRSAVDMWGPVPGLALMRRVKDQFDPRRRLAPGTFVGGI